MKKEIIQATFKGPIRELVNIADVNTKGELVIFPDERILEVKKMPALSIKPEEVNFPAFDEGCYLRPLTSQEIVEEVVNLHVALENYCLETWSAFFNAILEKPF